MAHINKLGWIYNFLAQQLSIRVGEVSVVAIQTEARAGSLVVTGINGLNASCSV